MLPLKIRRITSPAPYQGHEGNSYSSDEENVEVNENRSASGRNLYSSDEENAEVNDSRSERSNASTCSSEEEDASSANADTSQSEANSPLEGKRFHSSNSRPEMRDGRVRSKRKSIHNEKETSHDVVVLMLEMYCCERNCLNKIELSEAMMLREEFYSLKRDQQTDFIFTNIQLSYARDDQKITFITQGHRICETAWRNLFGVKKTRYYSVKKTVKNGKRQIDSRDGRCGNKFTSKKYLDAKNFIMSLTKKCGDYQPDYSQIHLPSCINKRSAFEDYTKQQAQAKEPAIGRRQFENVWADHFSNVKIRKFQKFTKCQECTNFREAMITKLSKEERLLVSEQRRIHLKLQELAREKYYKHRSKSRSSPKTYISCIIDNMDSGKTNLPRFSESFKNETSLAHIHHHVTGVLNHGLDKAFIFTWTDLFPSDCNVTLNCLMAVLQDAAEENGGHLPPVLYLQADNSAKDNKNRFVLMFLSMLVQADILKKVKLTFLMVGHTHEDVDQMFSCINRAANQRNLLTLDHLHAVCKEGFTPSPKTVHLSSMWDFRKLATFQGVLQGIQEPHVFKIHKMDGAVTISYKNWPLQTESYRHLRVCDIIPDNAEPSVVTPNISKMESTVADMKRDIRRWAESGKFSENDCQWWANYLESLSSPTSDIPVAPTSLPKFLDGVLEPNSLEANLAEALNRHMDRLQHSASLRIGRR